jgi:hypothetical protein
MKVDCCTRDSRAALYWANGKLIGWCFGIAVVACGGLLSTGCSSKQIGPELIPVHGIVTLNGKPLTTGGTVSFRNRSGLVEPSGAIGADGRYTLLLSPKQEGAPPGKYKVVVFASEPREEAVKHNRLPIVLVDRKYMDPKTTPLAVEVKKDAAPGAYDFSVTN